MNSKEFGLTDVLNFSTWCMSSGQLEFCAEYAIHSSTISSAVEPFCTHNLSTVDKHMKHTCILTLEEGEHGEERERGRERSRERVG